VALLLSTWETYASHANLAKPMLYCLRSRSLSRFPRERQPMARCNVGYEARQHSAQSVHNVRSAAQLKADMPANLRWKSPDVCVSDAACDPVHLRIGSVYHGLSVSPYPELSRQAATLRGYQQMQIAQGVNTDLGVYHGGSETGLAGLYDSPRNHKPANSRIHCLSHFTHRRHSLQG